jgi:hypothetical protein
MDQGRVLRDRFELHSVLGESEHAVTHLARDRRAGERCVVQSLPLGEGPDLRCTWVIDERERPNWALWIDLVDDGGLDPPTEHFLGGETARAGGRAFTPSLDCP